MEDPEVLQIFNCELHNYVEILPNQSLEQINQRRLLKIEYPNQSIEPLLKIVDEILEQKISEIGKSTTVLLKLTYCGAKTVLKLCEKNKIPIYDDRKFPNKFPESEEAQKELFRIRPKLFRQLLFDEESETETQLSDTPSIEEIEDFWSGIWSKKGDCDENAVKNYIEEEKTRINNRESMNSLIKIEDLKKALKKKKNWSPPGIDGIQTFWFKKFKSIHEKLVEIINHLIENPEEMPEFLTEGFTELFPKTEDTKSVSKYRPITYLSSLYKLITLCLHDKIFTHYEKNGILADEQCGGRKGYMGLKTALLVDSVVLSQKPIWGCYVDFKKAYDMVPHAWVLTLLRVYGVSENFVKFLEKSMQNWKTRLHLNSMLTKSVKFERGIFQGDSLSVLLYWTTINPLSFQINKIGRGLKLESGSVSHLFYMDDLKLYSSDLEGLKMIFKVVQDFSAATSMKINYEKTHVFSIPRQKNEFITFGENNIKYSQKETYLGYEQNPRIEYGKTVFRKAWSFGKLWKKIEDTKIDNKDKEIFKSKFLVGSLKHSFGILHWMCFKRKLLEIKCKEKKINGSVRKMCVGLEDVYLIYFNEIWKMRERFLNCEKCLIKVVAQNDKTTPLKLSSENDFLEPLVASVFRQKEGKSMQNKRRKTKRSKGART